MALDPESFTFEQQDHVLALLRACERTVSQGLTRMILVKRWRSVPRGNWDRKRIMPGVFGRIIGSTKPGHYLVDVHVADVVRALERVMRV
jgi:hypothetical protein